MTIIEHSDYHQHSHSYYNSPEQSHITFVCFILNIVLLCLHNLLITVYRQLWYLYGSFFILAFYALMTAYVILFMIAYEEFNYERCHTLLAMFQGCLLLKNAFITIASAHFVWTMKKTQVENLLFANFRRMTWLSLILYFSLACLFTCTFLTVSQIFSNKIDPQNSFHNSSLNITVKLHCDLKAIPHYTVTLIAPYFSCTILQIALLLKAWRIFVYAGYSKNRLSEYESCFLCFHFRIILKFLSGNLLVWSLAFLGVHMSNSVIWHLFALAGVLLILYIIITFVFSRPVLAALHATVNYWMSFGLPRQNIYSYSDCYDGVCGEIAEL